MLNKLNALILLTLFKKLMTNKHLLEMKEKFNDTLQVVIPAINDILDTLDEQHSSDSVITKKVENYNKQISIIKNEIAKLDADEAAKTILQTINNMKGK